MSELSIIGSCIGQYRVVREIGHGGMGIVYEAIHDEIGRRAAIKVPSPRYADEPRYVRRFLNEARAISRVRHQGLVQIYDFDQTPLGVLYILMELLEGETLRSRLERLARREALLPVAESRRIVRQIAAALRATHEQGIVHRDLKPANVMIVADEEAPGGERVKLLDFGIAQFLENQDAPLTAPSRTLGTVTYMAPEQCAGDDGIGFAADVYALGVILHELLTGAPPFDGATSSEVMRKHLLAEPPLLPETVPSDLTQLAARMLAKAPTLRPSMRDVMQVLACDKNWDVVEDRVVVDLAITETGEVHEAPSRLYRGPCPASTDPEGVEPHREGIEVPVEVPGSAKAIPPIAGAQLAKSRESRQRGKRVRASIAFGLIAALMLIWMPSEITAVGPLPQADPILSPPSVSDEDSATLSQPKDPESLRKDEEPPVSRHPGSGSHPPRPLPQATKSCPVGMLFVPGGTFQMGSLTGIGPLNEHPQHTVMLSGYCIDKTEVTARRYEVCVAAKGCTEALVVNGPPKKRNRYCNGNGSSRPEHPINCVDWNQAVAYCTWAGKRLPTEAEWEYAARGSDGRTYPWGDQEPNAKLLNACGTGCRAETRRPDVKGMEQFNDGWTSTAPVGSFPAGASPFGVLDMAGNVFEWTADWDGIYSDKSVTNPHGPEARGGSNPEPVPVSDEDPAMLSQPKGLESGPNDDKSACLGSSGLRIASASPEARRCRVVRGGSWLSSNPDVGIRATSRTAELPSERRVRIGFRCALGL